jgi:8-oxo-dGTP pyrophosphatase MutT (NUDIX family)
MTANTTIQSANGKRTFTCFPAAVMVFHINDNEEFLMLTSGNDEWQVVSGALEDNESILEGAIRESLEELGSGIQISPLGVVHALRFNFDETIQNMISILYVMRFSGGPVVPGDDMLGAQHQWWNLGQIRANIARISKPEKQLWLFERALDLFRQYRDETPDLEYSTGPVSPTQLPVV